MDDLTTDLTPPAIGRDEWIRAAVSSHSRLHGLIDESVTEARWRKECLKRAMAKGATQQQLAEVLGVTREQISKLTQ